MYHVISNRSRTISAINIKEQMPLCISLFTRTRNNISLGEKLATETVECEDRMWDFWYSRTIVTHELYCCTNGRYPLIRKLYKYIYTIRGSPCLTVISGARDRARLDGGRHIESLHSPPNKLRAPSYIPRKKK